MLGVNLEAEWRTEKSGLGPDTDVAIRTPARLRAALAARLSTLALDLIIVWGMSERSLPLNY